MSALRWVNGPYCCDDLVDEAGRLHGYTMPIGSAVRGFVIRRRSGGCAIFGGMEDYPTAEAARAYVEDLASRPSQPEPSR